MIGGLTDTKPSDKDVQQIVEAIKTKFEELNYNTDKFEPISYKTQVVNGVNYFVKLETDKEYVHLRIHQALAHNDSLITLHSYQSNKHIEEDIIYF